MGFYGNPLEHVRSHAVGCQLQTKMRSCDSLGMWPVRSSFPLLLPEIILSDSRHQIMGGRPGYYIRAPISHLWASYPTHVQLNNIASHLETNGRLTNGSWTGIPTTTVTALAEWFTQTPVLKHLCLIFDDIQSFLLDQHLASDKVMVYAGPSVPSHLQSTTAHPEAMLTMKAEVGKGYDWADVICPFESARHPSRVECECIADFGKPSLTK